MKRPIQKERGAILVMAAFILILLIGIAAFALDLGRLFVLHTEMQNAVDAAALSAAAELDGEAGAIDRAKTAANQEILNHIAHFSNQGELLKDLQSKDVFAFYTWIGSNVESSDPPSVCSPDPNDPDPDGKCFTDQDDEASYVQIKLNPADAGDDRYEIDLYFLPVLSLFGIPTATTASTQVEALAGTHYEVCDYPPILICDPAEGGGEELFPGDMVDLKEQKDPSKLWGPGFFGWLVPKPPEKSEDPGDDGLAGNQLLARRLGSKYGEPCAPPMVEPNPGNKGNWPRWALNTRFGLYQHGFFKGSDQDDYPSAPNVIDYPRDDNIHPVQIPLGNRFGDGVWIETEAGYEDRPSVFSTIDYNSSFHVDHTLPVPPMISRLEYYNWELTGANLPENNIPGAVHPDEQQCLENGPHSQKCRMLGGEPFFSAVKDPINEFNRRELFVAVVACEANGIKGGTKPFNVNDVDGKWMRFLMTEHVSPPSVGEGVKVVAEFIEEVTEKEDEHFKKVIQLYE